MWSGSHYLSDFISYLSWCKRISFIQTSNCVATGKARERLHYLPGGWPVERLTGRSRTSQLYMREQRSKRSIQKPLSSSPHSSVWKLNPTVIIFIVSIYTYIMFYKIPWVRWLARSVLRLCVPFLPAGVGAGSIFPEVGILPRLSLRWVHGALVWYHQDLAWSTHCVPPPASTPPFEWKTLHH